MSSPKLFYRVVKKITKLALYAIVFFALLFGFMLQTSPVVEKQATMSPSEMSLAKNKTKEFMDKLAAQQTSVELKLSTEDLYRISKLGTHLIPKTRINISTSNFGVFIAFTTDIHFMGKWFVNGHCLLTKTNEVSELDTCKLGNLPIPGALIEALIIESVDLAMGESVAKTVEELIDNSQYSNSALTLKANKDKFFKDKVNDSMSALGDLAAVYTQSSKVSPELVQFYTKQIELIQSKQLSDYITILFTQAQERTKNSDAIKENTAIIWALAVKFGHYRFASLMGINSHKTQQSQHVPLLRGRTDLTKHFIYSAALQQLGEVDIGLSIGEAKELLDSASGGSGFSFPDLAADKAGLKFAKFVTSSTDNAEFSQAFLKDIEDESSFFPFVHDLPEGFKTKDFERVISSIESDVYKHLEHEIDTRVSALPLYLREQKEMEFFIEPWARPSHFNYNFSHKVDTHIHTKYSDGSHLVDEIAQKAFNFGCEAIAITDHGDKNLTSLMTEQYFAEIAQAQAKYPYLTIIPGLEWNIPPMSGREHVTLILPDSPNLKRNLIKFRNTYDHLGRFDENSLSPEKALKWLEKYGEDGGKVKPMLIYNHPARKNHHLTENQHDYVYWRKYSNLVLGFSGAPGHQKKRDHKNGSYEMHMKTVNGWDPSIANVGGEWDRLLQKGYKIWGARANSDFHNTKMDYWPCQFSSTHVMARSNHHNDIIKGFQKGDYWAQHGNYVDSVDFNVQLDGETLTMGTEGFSAAEKQLNIELSVSLNNTDWKGQPTKLDELELIIITENKIDSKIFNHIEAINGIVKLTYPYTLNSNFVIFRWRGKNIQPEQHSYMFYTNPIKVNFIKN